MNITPTFIRPYVALVARLPVSLPLGAATLRMTNSTAATSNSVAVQVLSRPAQAVRIFQSGEAKAHPYTIAFASLS